MCLRGRETLLVHLALAVRRLRIAVGRLHLATGVLWHALHRMRLLPVLRGHLTARRCVADGRQLTHCLGIARGRVVLLRPAIRRIMLPLPGLSALLLHRLALPLFVSFALVLFLLLAGLPFLADLLELCLKRQLLGPSI